MGNTQSRWTKGVGGGILFVAFRGKVRNLRKLHRVNPPPPRASSHRNWSKLAELPCRDKSMGL